MDIFNLKRVEELERELTSEKRKNEELQLQLDYAESSLKNVLEIKETIPDGCFPGEYCRACEFSKDYYYDSYIYLYLVHNTSIRGTLCNKANVCPNFTQKEIKDGAN
jgi:hypothetical protein